MEIEQPPPTNPPHIVTPMKQPPFLGQARSSAQTAFTPAPLPGNRPRPQHPLPIKPFNIHPPAMQKSL